MTRIFTTILASAAITVISTPAMAEPATIATKVAVSHADLDLTTQAGRKQLDRRINSAAIAACGQQPEARDLQANQHFDRCYKAALTGVQAQIAKATGTNLAAR